MPIAECPRCQGTRFVHVADVMDHMLDVANTWRTRPVGLLAPRAPRSEAAGQGEPVGRFETWSCTTCGHTRWYARAWERLRGSPRLAFCSACESSTEHHDVVAVENVAGGFQRVFLGRVAGALTDTLIRTAHAFPGRGPMRLWICEPCGLVQWLVEEYAHLRDGMIRDYAARLEHDRACLACGATDALVLTTATEFEGEGVAVGVQRKRFLGMRFDEGKGHYSLRICERCHVVEWRARNLESVLKSGGGELRESDPPQNPYR